jgi:hypothetical protein
MVFLFNDELQHEHLTLFYSCFFVVICQCQQFGGEPASVKWKQLNTDTLRVIFPTGLNSVAKRIATLLNRAATL